jgi:putative hemolysin
MESSAWFDVLGLFSVLVLVLVNAFFVAAEFSLVSVRRTRIAELVGRGDLDAVAVQRAIENPDRVIAATQLGITLASLGLGWVGEPALTRLLDPVVAIFPESVHSGLSHSISAVVAFVVITFMHVVIGELAPKSIALQNPERTSLFVARPTLWTERLFKPAIWILNGTGNALLRLVGVHPASGHQLAHSVEELKMLVSASEEDGVVEAGEREMLHAVFDFSELVVRQVMVPRTEVVAVEASTPVPEVINLIAQNNYTKYPVYVNNLDQIIGIVHVKDLLGTPEAMNAILDAHLSLREKIRPEPHTTDNQPGNGGNDTPAACVVGDFVRETLFVPETLSVGALLGRFRDNRQHIAIVMDEYGGTAGLVTLEDLLEEIVGEVGDQFDEINSEFQILPDGSILIDGLTRIEDVNQQLNLNLKEPDYDTIAGYVMGKLDRIPHLHDVVEGNGVRIRVEEMNGLRIARVALTRKKNPDAAQPTSERKDITDL